jgi:phosphoribosylaminoimidazole-succinocarboxamide synthase
VPEKGAVLNTVSHFSLTLLESQGIKTHLVATGAYIDQYLPEPLHGNVDLQSRAMVVRWLKVLPIEFVVRSTLTGSGLREYQETGTVCGNRLPPGLQDGDALLEPILTPTTKAEDGHDQPLDVNDVVAQYSDACRLVMRAFHKIAGLAKRAGIKLADTKFELGQDEHGNWYIVDEVMTPDSSRFWSLETWQESREAETRKAPPALDKQLARQWGIEMGIDTLNPENPADVTRVHAMRVPSELVEQLRRTYRYIFWLLTDTRLETYQRQAMQIDVHGRRRRVAVLFGSENDIPCVERAIATLSPPTLEYLRQCAEVNAISCHRNPEKLRTYVEQELAKGKYDAIVAAGAKAFALPGVVDAWLHEYMDDPPPVIGVALGEPGSIALEAAKRSISELPGTPVIMDETGDGPTHAYEGPEGFMAAVLRAMTGEFPVPPLRERKEPVYDIRLFDPPLVQK